MKRQTRNLGRCRCCVNRQHIIRIIWVNRKNRFNHLHLVAQAFHKRWTKWPINHTSRKNRVSTSAPFTAEERTWNTPSSICTLFHIYCEREEIEMLARLRRNSCSGKNRGFAVKICHNCACSLAGKQTRFKTNRASAERTVIDNGFS
ncbi:Uncharacterised protein [Chlamydia trachomatis]|nr:Uncharacterised protein [Chlamydia trachomatis]